MNKIKPNTLIGLGTLASIFMFSVLLYFYKQQDKQVVAQAPEQATDASVTTATIEQARLAPVYGALDDSEPTIQISEETRKSSASENPAANASEAALELPKGFGLEGVEDPKAQANAEQGSEAPAQAGADAESQKAEDAAPEKAAAKEGLKESPVALETPSEAPKPPVPSANIADNGSNIEAVDPRTIGVANNDGPEKDYEETVLTVQRTLTAVSPTGEKQLIRLKIPVMYKSRTLRLEGDTKTRAVALLRELKLKGEELARIKADLEKALKDWNTLVKDSTPYESLLPESPTLPQNQSANKLNRDDNPSMAAGKSISYEIINK